LHKIKAGRDHTARRQNIAEQNDLQCGMLLMRLRFIGLLGRREDPSAAESIKVNLAIYQIVSSGLAYRERVIQF